jgi:hypothetical protein
VRGRARKKGGCSAREGIQVGPGAQKRQDTHRVQLLDVRERNGRVLTAVEKHVRATRAHVGKSLACEDVGVAFQGNRLLLTFLLGKIRRFFKNSSRPIF